MTFSPALLFSLSLLYLGSLFLVAYASENGWIPLRWVRHPIVYTLSLGVFVSVWGLYGVVQFAAESGYNFLTYYLGLSGAFLLSPMFLQPLLRLAKTHQLNSLPDLLAFRFRSQTVGTLTTLAIVVGMMPLLTAQMQTMADLARMLTGQTKTRSMGLVFCIILIGFTLLFGTRQRSSRQLAHEGLVAAIAFDSLIKLVGLGSVALFAYFGVMGGQHGLNQWLNDNPQALARVYEPLNGGHWHSLLLVFFFAAVVMPGMYQMTFNENRQPRDLITASWGLPLYLLLMALGVPIILWAGEASNLHLPTEYFSLGIALQAKTPALMLTLFMGSLAAASGILIVTTLALANMMLNHVLLPLRGWKADDALYQQTLRMRRAVIVFIPLSAYMLSWLPQLRPDSTEMSMLAFVAILQLAPGVLALLFWPRATRQGLCVGLAIGISVWFFALVLPALFMPGLSPDFWQVAIASKRLDHWQYAGLVASLGNGVGLVVVSLFFRQSDSDRKTAETCSVDNLRSHIRWSMAAQSVPDFITALAPALGPITAEREINLALTDLGLTRHERRPYALRRLREQVGANLSGLLGPSVAQELIDSQLPQNQLADNSGEDIHYIESRLEEYRDKLSGLAAELDMLRRFHRQTLHDLPLGVCTLAGDLEVLSWNRAMMDITGCADEQVIGSRLSALPAPWNRVLSEFLDNPSAQQLRTRLENEGQVRWVNLHRAVIGDAAGSQVLVMEDASAMQQLESRLHHAERLAAVGRLAAGVAHEIGNPVTGIACLAQNLRAEHSKDSDVHASASDILEQTHRVTRIVQSLVSFSRSKHHVTDDFEAVQLAGVVEEAVHLIKLSPEARQTQFRLHVDSALRVTGDAQRLCQVFINLLTNARDASTQQGEIVIRANRTGGQVRIEVEDFGHGLPDGAIRDTLFEPFVTTKSVGKGTGLGLALVHGIIEAHQGRIQLVDKRDYDQGQGVIVQLTLPVWRASKATPVEEETL